MPPKKEPKEKEPKEKPAAGSGSPPGVESNKESEQAANTDAGKDKEPVAAAGSGSPPGVESNQESKQAANTDASKDKEPVVGDHDTGLHSQTPRDRDTNKGGATSDINDTVVAPSKGVSFASGSSPGVKSIYKPDHDPNTANKDPVVAAAKGGSLSSGSVQSTYKPPHDNRANEDPIDEPPKGVLFGPGRGKSKHKPPHANRANEDPSELKGQVFGGDPTVKNAQTGHIEHARNVAPNKTTVGDNGATFGPGGRPSKYKPPHDANKLDPSANAAAIVAKNRRKQTAGSSNSHREEPNVATSKKNFPKQSDRKGRN